jgi:hypothetical protein
MRAALLAAAIVLLAAGPAYAAPELVKIGDFQDPVHVASPPGDTRVFVVEQRGLVNIAGAGTFLDLRNQTVLNYERGLLSIAFSPNYATSGLFYVFLTAQPGGDIEVREYRQNPASPNLADPTLLRTLVDEPHGATNHNGGQLQFGPDGLLYVSIGDNANGALAQANGPYGKILRVDTATGATQNWASGLRNPWRFTFDRATGDMLIGDVGEGTWEEVNWARAGTGVGVNYGWPCREGGVAAGGSCTGATSDPAFSRHHDDGYAAIIGGYVVRDPGLPTLNGRYLYGDSAIDRLRSVVLPDTGDRAEALPVPQLSSFGEDACGRIYAASLGNDAVYRIQDGAPTPCEFGGPAPDLTAPGVRVSLRGLKGRTLRVRVRCSEASRRPSRAACAASGNSPHAGAASPPDSSSPCA